MTYKTHHMFPIPFYEFDFSNHVEEVLDLIKNEAININPYYPTIRQTDNQTLHTMPEWNFLKAELEDCLLSIQKDEGYDPNFGNLKLTKLWANIAYQESNGNQAQHRHPMSYLSGIFYLTEGAPTSFLDPCYARSLSAIEIPNNHMYNSFNIQPKPGLVVIFPSFVQHFSEEHTGNNDRITMSFNCLPESLVGE